MTTSTKGKKQEKLPNWVQHMQTYNPALKIFRRANGGYMFCDTSRTLEVLSIHAELQTSKEYCSNPYYRAITKKENIPTPPWVPLLPGYCVIGKLCGQYIRLEIQSNNGEHLIYSWEIYENVEMSELIYSGANSDFFVSMKKYIKLSGEISIPDVLGLRDPNIIYDLQLKVNSIYPHLFNITATKSQNKIAKLTTTMQKKGEKLLKKVSVISQPPIICHGIEIKEPGMQLTPEATLALAVEYEALKKLEDTSRKRIKRAKTNNEYMKNLKYKLHEEKDQELLNNWIQKTLEETNIGSTIFVSTDQYLTSIYTQPCLTWHNLDLSKKKLDVHRIGHNLQIKIKCKICQGITEYSNESPNAQFSSLAVGAGLVGGVNRQQLQTIFSIIGITAQLSKGHYHNKQNEYLEKINDEVEISAQIALTKAIAHIKAKGERILPTSFDCSWSHCRNANQASGELIYQGNLDGYDHKPVIAFATAEKPRKLKKRNGQEYEVFHGNHEKTSRQMEHAILLRIIEKIVPVLEAAEVLLDIGVDGDLNSNKTLNNIPCVSKVYADLKHIGKNIRAKIAKSSMWKEYENTIMTYYNSCVYAASGRKLDENKITVSDAELEKVQIDAPHLKEYTSNQKEKFRQFLKECFYIPTKQSLITHIRTSYNEAFNRVKLCFQDKKIDYWKTYSTRHALAVLQYNNERGKKIKEQKTNLETFDWDKDFVPYGRNVQEKIKAKEFEPTFAKHILDFEKIQKCLACKAFPKYSPLGLCRYHEFCFKYGWYQEFPNKQYIPPPQNLIANPPTSYDILVKMFGYQEFQDMQEIAISSYVNGKYTFISMRTGAGKTMCYWISAILCGGLTVVISPLVSLIDDQVIETIAAGIGCASIYTEKHQPSQYFEKVFSEIAIGLIKILYITAESFINNSSFTRMLLNFAKYAPVSFVIDEVHCIIECKHFRESWSKLRKISTFFPSSPIMMLTGTCKESDAYLILENLGLASNDVAFVRGLSFSRPELTMKMHSKSTKEKTIGEIITLLKELNEGKCIIYCPTVRICDDVYEQLQEKSGLGLPMAVYYSSLDSEEKKKLKSWKENTIQLMIATNAFGMDLNDKKVRLVIHYSFPLSIGNFVQETRRAGRDHNPAKCIIFYTRHDICTNYTIITQSRESITEDMNDSFEANKRKEYLAKACEKIFEVVHFCEEQYICKKQMLAEYFAWNGDNLSPPCAHCDNCLRVQAELVHEVDVKTDAIKMVEVVEEIINKLRESGKLISPKDIIQVYCQLKCDNEELTSLNIYRET
ncbi:uncharacterized protein OCT59_018907 [Rhizophagus irregularis]|uniref:uncharacterized protein n=1 Tax=Rhizophagus irregularis TaxID=588596 RepID=UPI003324A04B|nr:hypothetical protein OCT59_018907 [Rhizophagus irregularis]